MEFRGIYTPVITPFKTDGSIDFDAYTAHVKYLVGAGVQGLVIGGTTGEYYVESHDERVKLLQLAKEQAMEGVQVVFGTGSVNPEDSIKLAQAAAENGADAILVATPPYSLPTQEELVEHALTIDKAANLPVMLYNYPDRMGVNMEKTFFDAVMSQSSNFVSIKESSGDINRLHMLVSDYPDLQVSCGMDDQALEFFAWGCQSWVCAGSNFLPKQHLALYQACVVEKDFVKGRKIMAAMMPLMRVLEQGGKFIQCVKQGVEIDGRFAGEVRKPLMGLSEDEKRQMADVIDTLKSAIAAL
ncbi:dihydrodipicolinate synthase family protein [Vibrio sp. B1FLJ16]|uniref:dihydrodipicolinate synthase family protein n=1 Tax=Vibrio sp. B1FLJ16 TaxID=2751178 RepID=UPI0015F69DE1|nr:dihydrodipicolinate synthase family protein [Vibrio sp. B1FLJ16]CAD7807160.1 Dihydrodipicolinate synthetase family [Vibrio sp. B1FLJ16]CAE6904992.1 Dihydrodipicolinate synthetase family [Vibrio sp. B1FLJ16]